MKPYDQETTYDAQIAPLMAQIIAICKEHQIPMIASFAYRRDKNDEYDLCTTALPNNRGEAPAAFAGAIGIIYRPGTELEGVKS